MLTNTLLFQGQALGGGTGALVFTPDAQLVLAEGSSQGSYLSAAFDLPSVRDVVACWNSTTPPGTWVELSVRVGKDGNWSRWFSYGRWADNGANTGSIADQQDLIACLEIDLVRCQDCADAIQFRLDLFRPDPTLPSPRVRLVACTWTPVEPGPDLYSPAEIALAVPPRAQLPVPEIGREICSPTSLAMVMAYHGYSEPTERVAAGVRDNGAEIYGNWSYNIAYAAEKGFTAWVQRCDSLADVKHYLEQGLPVIASIRTADKAELDGTIMPYPAGHLLVITGLSHHNGTDYVLVNDPAAHRDQDVPRAYRRDQFERAWARRRIYVIKPK